MRPHYNLFRKGFRKEIVLVSFLFIIFFFPHQTKADVFGFLQRNTASVMDNFQQAFRNIKSDLGDFWLNNIGIGVPDYGDESLINIDADNDNIEESFLDDENNIDYYNEDSWDTPFPFPKEQPSIQPEKIIQPLKQIITEKVTQIVPKEVVTQKEVIKETQITKIIQEITKPADLSDLQSQIDALSQQTSSHSSKLLSLMGGVFSQLKAAVLYNESQDLILKTFNSGSLVLSPSQSTHIYGDQIILDPAGAFNVNPRVTIKDILNLDGYLSQVGSSLTNTLEGNVDAQNGLDITGANLTVGGSKFTVDSTTGNIASLGNLLIDANVLYVDASTDRVGIGTTSPQYVLDVNGTLRASSIIGTTIFTPYAQTIIVAKSGGDYTTITAALNSITDASATKPYVVKVMAGVYNEAVTMKSFVNIEGEGWDAVKITHAVGPTVLANSTTASTSISNLTIETTPSAAAAVNRAVEARDTASLVVYNARITSSSNDRGKGVVTDVSATLRVYNSSIEGIMHGAVVYGGAASALEIQGTNFDNIGANLVRVYTSGKLLLTRNTFGKYNQANLGGFYTNGIII